MAERTLYITEVAPRDGLQNEAITIPTVSKIAFIDLLSQSGVQEIEVTSFVSPKWIPQLADADEVCRNIKRNPKVVYSALVPNEKGMERVLACDLKKIALFTAASETFNQKNINASIDESLVRFRPVIEQAQKKKIFVRGYLSTAFHCPYEGPIAPEKVLEVSKKLMQEGVGEISIGDTIGKASPIEVRHLLDLLLKEIPAPMLSLHLHDTYGMAIANALVAFEEYGVVRFDASAGGLGGCPYAAGASGNVATEDLVYTLCRSGASSSVDPSILIRAVSELAPLLSHPLCSRLFRVGTAFPEKLKY